MIRFVNGAPPLFPCLGGYKFFYLDWELMLYRCAFLQETLGNILEIEEWGPTASGAINVCGNVFATPASSTICLSDYTIIP